MIAYRSRFLLDRGLGSVLGMRAVVMWPVIVGVPCTSF